MRTYKATYYDKRGIENITVQSDGSDLYLDLRGIEFSGSDFDMLSGKVDFNIFDYELFSDGFGSLTNFIMDINIPISLFDASNKSISTENLSCEIEVGENINILYKERESKSMVLKSSFGVFSIEKKTDYFEESMIAIQNKLPKTVYLNTCLSCKYSNYHPIGNGLFGSLYCFKHLKEELKAVNDKFDFMDLWTEEAVNSGNIFSIQETYDCSDHQLPTENDWTYKDWNKYID